MGIYIFISILVLIACVLVIMVVLVQNSKGGGLAANFTSAGQSMGVRKTADFLEKSTWTLAAAIVLLCLVATIHTKRSEPGISHQGINRESSGSHCHSYAADTCSTGRAED